MMPLLLMRPGQSVFLPALLFWTNCLAAELVTPVSVTSITAAADFFPVARLIDNSGLSGPADLSAYSTISHAGASASNAWVTNAPGGGGSDYYATGSPDPVLTFILDDTYELTDLVVWGYHFGNPNNNESRGFTVEFSQDGGVSWSGSVMLSHARTASGNESLPFGAANSADAVRITITDNHFGAAGAGGGDRIGLGEVKFIGTLPPDPNPVIAIDQIVDFGNLPANAPAASATLAVSNLGHETELEISAPSPEAPFGITGLPVTIPPGESRDLNLTFDPEGVSGCYFTSLRLATNDPEHPMVSVHLIGAVDCDLPPPSQPGISPPEGTFTSPIEVTVTTGDDGAVLIYTTDGSVPDLGNGIPYTGPIAIDHSTQIRAAAVRGGSVSKPQTKSYLRLSAGLETFTSPLPIVLIDNFGGGAIPDKGWTTGAQTGAGLKQVAMQPAFLQIVARDPGTGLSSITGPTDLTERIGIRVRGAFSSTWYPKPYNLETWKEDDSDKTTTPLGLPGESDWVLYYPHPSYDRTMLYNTFIWEVSRQTGRYGTQFRFVEVFINEDGGDLTLADRRGVYAFAEKVTRDDDRLDFEPLSEDGTTGGWLLSLNRMDPDPAGGFPTEDGATSPQFFHTAGPNRIHETPPNAAGRGDDIPRQYNAFLNFDDPQGYRINTDQRAAIEDWFDEFEDVLYDDAVWRDPMHGYRKYVNTRDFADYFHLLNLAKQGDGLLLSVFPWVSSGDRRLHMGPMWDFNNGAYSGSTTSPLKFRGDRLWYPRLFNDPDFLREYIDRWYELRRGPLDTANMHAIIDAQAAEITAGLASAQGLSATTWNSRLNAMKSYLQARAAWLDDQYFQPPSFSHPGAVVGTQFALTITNATGTAGTIYFTVDGSDPLDGGGTAYATPITFNASANIKARIQASDGEWSALNAATFVTGLPAGPGDLVVSEIMYHPPGNPDAEFLEVRNVNPFSPLDLSLVHFVAGVEFTFPVNTILAPGESCLVVRNSSAFESVHGTGLPIAGEFEHGTALDNSGDRIVLEAADGSVILGFTYNDKHPWPDSSDGGGDSLVLIDPSDNPDHDDAANWRSSGSINGTPGGDDRTVFTGIAMNDLDQDDLPALLEHVLGTSDTDPDLLSASFTWSHQDLSGTAFRIVRNLTAEDATLTLEFSDDLLSWDEVTVTPVLEAHLAGGLARFLWEVPTPQPARHYFRLRASVR